MVITRLEDLVKLRALAKLCGVEFFDDMSLLVVAWRRILEVLVLAMPPVVEKKARRGKKQKKKKNDPRKLEILDACVALGRAYNWVEDCDDARRYYKRAKEGYEEQLGRDSENVLDVTRSLIGSDGESRGVQIEKLRELLKRMERVLGEEHVLTLEMLNKLGCELKDNGEYEEAREVYERFLAGQLKVLGEEHKDTLCTLNNLGIVYQRMKDYEKAFEYYERALKGHERLLGKNHPSTLIIVMDIAIIYDFLKDYGKDEELYERALEGYEVQLGKDNGKTKKFARNFKQCLDEGGNNSERLAALMSSYPGLAVKK
ncbi:hypothetical protein TL16_g00460 [Triparma laevis f. inornata]|uniref:Kinesin light chain n=1 Tax=Triparma laevis f. inornata TaxID=1714386 RepID=A0A9W7DN62_9STRA|nr:hypothetical protein TL16_g00460 [Triparma laevis f. inornata]